MIDHISIAVNDFAKSSKFYDETLALIGYSKLMSFGDDNQQSAGYGKDNKPAFWIGTDKTEQVPGEQVGKARGVHIAFIASSAEEIKNWHKKCLELGGRDNGAPGPRPEYHPAYYGAFIIDPNGWRIEAVMHNYKAK